jgi:dihydrolipoamide dehydrogenase
MADTSFDVVVIGGGPGGYVAAIRTAQLGLKAAVVEKAELGGICLNWGCIPTKALLRTAEIYRLMRHAGSFGLAARDVGFDLAKIVERSRKVAKQLNSGVAHLLRKNKVQVFDGEGRLDGARKVVVAKDAKELAALAAKHVILATGARPRTLPGLEPDGRVVWTYMEALLPDAVPKRLLVVGSGAIGIEFASFFRDLGSQVTVVEILPRILPAEDEEVSAFARKQFERAGIKIITSAKVAKIDRKGDAAVVTVAGGDGKTSTVEADRVISAVGVVGNVENLGLESTKAKIDRGAIVAGDFGLTAEPGLYAIGDVAGPPMLAHKASHEGIACVEKIAGLAHAHALDKTRVPGCTYCHPQVASVGWTEAQAKAAGREVRVGHFPFIANGKAIALGETEGMIKTVFDRKTGELLGAHMIGAEVTELIQGFAIAIGLETTEAELMATVFPHPTLSEMMHESVLDAFGRAVHF